jgi:multimeric flavodoxin WrbA
MSDVKPTVTDASGKNRIALITSSDGNDLSLENMINLFVSNVEAEVNIFRIPEMNIIGGCLGCFKCAFEGKCFYPDGFDDFHRNNIMNADAIVYAARVKNHWLGSDWKYFDDRQFYNGHRTSMMGKPIAYLLAGNLRDNQNLRQVLEYRADLGRLYLTGIVTDECEDNEKNCFYD